ncbi:hypothetical protein DH2020_033784 [Rehmannia glutinosa]|uniref:Reverse transcriptase zinc-binding domain n=1 Tax=Rehmannia glutinosa TaxID=99300 RepID=A0ABR0VE66_REHGL
MDVTDETNVAAAAVTTAETSIAPEQPLSWIITWRSILEGRRILFVGCRKQIFSGRTTSIWGDRWIPKPPTFTPSLTHSNFPRDALVSSLIIGNSDCHWDTDLVRNIFTPDDAKLILSLPLCAGNHNDRWVWHFTKNGKYSVKSAYHTIIANPNSFPEATPLTSSSSGPDPVWKILWKLKVPSRVLHFAWRLLTDTLPSPQNLARRSLSVPQSCPLCLSTDSSLSHLFFLCSFSDKVWYYAGLTNVIHTFTHPLPDTWAKSLLVNSPPHIGELFISLCYAIWGARNQRIFENAEFQPYIIVSSVFHTIQSFHSANLWPERSNLPRWSSSFGIAPPGTHVFFDGSISPAKSCAGAGIFIRNKEKRFVFGFAKRFDNISNPLFAEALALKEALLLIQTKEFQDVCVLGDSLSIILAAKGDAEVDFDCQPILEDIRSLLPLLNSVHLFWINRSLNSVAHELAYFAKNSETVTSSWVDPPEFLYHSMLDDFQQ